MNWARFGQWTSRDQLCRLDAFATSQGDKDCVEVEEESSNEETMAPKFGLLMPSSKLTVSRCPNITVEGLNNWQALFLKFERECSQSKMFLFSILNNQEECKAKLLHIIDQIDHCKS